MPKTKTAAAAAVKVIDKVKCRICGKLRWDDGTRCQNSLGKGVLHGMDGMTGICTAYQNPDIRIGADPAYAPRSGQYSAGPLTLHRVMVVDRKRQLGIF